MRRGGGGGRIGSERRRATRKTAAVRWWRLCLFRRDQFHRRNTKQTCGIQKQQKQQGQPPPDKIPRKTRARPHNKRQTGQERQKTKKIVSRNE